MTGGQMTHYVDVDTMDVAASTMTAAGCCLQVEVLRREGPSSWPLVRVSGRIEKIVEWLQREGYDMNAHEVRRMT